MLHVADISLAFADLRSVMSSGKTGTWFVPKMANGGESIPQALYQGWSSWPRSCGCQLSLSLQVIPQLLIQLLFDLLTAEKGSLA